MKVADRVRIEPASLAWLAVCFVVGCAAPSNQLIVATQTNYRADAFDTLRVVLEDLAGREVGRREADAAELVLTPRRAAHRAVFDGVPAGTYVVTVELLDGPRLIEQRRRITVRRDYSLYVYLDDSCAEVSCPLTPGGEPAACVGGECTTCGAGSDAGECACLGCTDTECGIARCVEGLCALLPNDALCADGGRCSSAGLCGPPTCPAAERTLQWVDRDGDGLGGSQELRCLGPGIVGAGGDCDDTDPDIGRCENCGNGVTDGVEGCDDGNATDGDGCDTNCTVTNCGNGIVTGDEGCDDGNAVDDDGCSNVCARPEESCLPDAADGASDEDLDGIVDEGCPYYFDSERDVGFTDRFALEPVGAVPTWFFLSRNAAARVRLLRRTSPDAPLVDAGVVAFDDTVAPGMRVEMLTVLRTSPEAACEGYVQVVDTDGLGRPPWIRRAVREPCTPDDLATGWRLAEEVSAPADVSAIFHPFLSDDGLVLLARGLTIDAPTSAPLLIGRRATREASFDLQHVTCAGESSCDGAAACTGNFPAVTDAGDLVFECGGAVHIARAVSPSAFGPPERQTSDWRVRPVFVPRTREVFSLSGRARYTRDAQRTEAPLVCVGLEVLANDGHACISVDPAATWSPTLCPGVDRHAFVGAERDLPSTPALVGPHWIGAEDDPGVGLRWVTGEICDLGDLDVGRDGAIALEGVRGDLYTERARTEVLPVLCEREPWPTWGPSD